MSDEELVKQIAAAKVKLLTGVTVYGARAVAMRKNAGHGGLITFPAGTSIATDGVERDNADIAREILDYQANPPAPPEDDCDPPHVVQG